MPKSRGRKPSKRRRLGADESGRTSYRPGLVEVNEQQGLIGLANLGPDHLLEIGLPVWWLMLQHGNPANVCLDGALVLKSAYAQFGITAAPKLVELAVHDQVAGQVTGYGTATPHFTGDTFVGHMGLWLATSRRFIDHSVQQFPQVRAESWLPMTVPLASSGVTGWGEVAFAAPRGQLVLEYTPLHEQDNIRILSHPYLAIHAAEHHRVGINVASNLLQVLRIEEFRDRAMATPHSRLHALLATIGDAEVVADAQSNLRFLMPDTEQTGGVYLDHITLPPTTGR